MKRISYDRISHIARRHPEWLAYCLRHMATVLAAPEYLGCQANMDRRRVEFVRRVEDEHPLLLVAVKFLDGKAEAWVSTTYPMDARYLTRGLKAGTMSAVSRGP